MEPGPEQRDDYAWGGPPPDPHQFEERAFPSQGGGFPPSNDPHSYHRRHQNQHNRRHDYHHDDEFPGGGDEYFHHHNGPSDGSFGSNYELGHGHGRSRPNHPSRKRRSSIHGYPDGGNYVKVFVGGISSTATEEEVGTLFEKHGSVVEVVLVRDKRSGRQCEYCFVKYATINGAENAIRALHNQYIWPGTVEPMRVKYADGEKERLGTVEPKVYVNGLNKLASKEEIINLFSHFGVVEDVYIMLDEYKESRGCGFVAFAQRDMAFAAIDALNGTYVMNGCERPLVVRLAEPKKPRNGEHRPGPSHMNIDTPPMVPQTGYPPYPCAENAPTIRGGTPTSIPIQFPQQGGVAPHPSFHLQIHAHDSPPMNQSPRTGSGQAQPAAVGSAPIRSTSVTLSSPQPSVTPPAPLQRAIVEGILNCDWSEHVGPDGFKYYYNCMTFESRWEKPEELTLYEQQFGNLHVEQQHQFWEDVPQGMQCDGRPPLYEENNSGNPRSCGVEHSMENGGHMETSLNVVGPASAR